MASVALVPLVTTVSPAAAPPPPPDAVERRATAALAEFTSWLDAGRATGVLGEVGWPSDDVRWGSVADAVYRSAAAARLGVAAWATGEIWSSSYRLLAYRSSGQYEPVTQALPQAAVVERQQRRELRGVNVEQGAFGEWGDGYDVVAAHSPLDNRNGGAYGRIYSYPSAATYRFLADRGIAWIRLPFRWERVQKRPGGPLDGTELRRLRDSVRAARAAGLDVVLDVHNYGAYYLDGVRRPIGTAAVSIGDFADLWRRLARVFRDEEVLAYALMNEPVDLRGGATTWERASQAAVTAVRTVDRRTRVYVASYEWGGTWQFARHHSKGPWIDDPTRRATYEAHLYFDGDRSGNYRLDYDAELRGAARAGF
jgi:hypothetical protein